MTRTHLLLSRQSQQAPNDPGQTKSWAITVAVVAAILVAIGLTGIVAFRIKKRQVERHRRLNSTSSEDHEAQNGTTPSRRLSQIGTNRNSTFNANRLSVRSIRSIISLPPYKETPRETEEVIARAGDREGLDYIVEGPETAEEVEVQRREEMAAIFRVQQTRRRELEERAERRRARRTALDAQDYREVARLDRAAADARRRQRNGSSGNLGLGNVVEGPEPSSGDLIAELQEIRSRQRRVSEVTYGDLGTARHDGSRLRAQSVESDLHPLLESSASIDGRQSTDSRNRSRASSVTSQARPRTGNRERSRSRASRNGVGDDTAELTRSLSDSGIPPEPPSYEDDLSVHAGNAPRYEDVIRDTPGHSRQTSSDGPPTAATTTTAVPTPPSSSELPPQPEIVHTASSPPISPHDLAGDGEAAPAAPSAVPARLQTRNIMTPPAIEVVSATPVHSAPSTPTASHFSAPRE